MRILIGSLTYPLPNGVSTSINTSYDGLTAAGHQVKIIAPDYQLGQARPGHLPLDSSAIGRLLTSLFGKEERMFATSAKGKIEAIVQQFQPDICWLHTLTWAANAFEKVMLDSKSLKILTYHTLVENYGRIYAGTIGASRMRERSKEVANSVDQVIAPSRIIEQKLRHYGVKKPIAVIPTGVQPAKSHYSKAELAKKFNFDPQAFLLLHTGRVSKEKNIKALLKMAERLSQVKPNFQLVFIGPGDIEEVLAQASQLGLGDKVICTGPVKTEELRRCYGGADLFVFASQTETQGLVVNEAMLSATPVVALDSPIAPEVYPSGTAVVVGEEGKFAEEVATLLADPAKRKKIGLAGQKFAQAHFSTEVMLKRQIQLFEQLLAAKA